MKLENSSEVYTTIRLYVLQNIWDGIWTRALVSSLNVHIQYLCMWCGVQLVYGGSEGGGSDGGGGVGGVSHAITPNTLQAIAEITP